MTVTMFELDFQGLFNYFVFLIQWAKDVECFLCIVAITIDVRRQLRPDLHVSCQISFFTGMWV